MIFYFSGAGSNQYIAEQIAKVVGDDLVDLSEKMDSRDYTVISNTRPIVFIVPVYAGQIPNVVQDYIKRAILCAHIRKCRLSAKIISEDCVGTNV